MCLSVIWSIGGSHAAAQRCDGVQVEIGMGEQRCLKPGGGESFKDCPGCPDMVVIPAGSFTMGALPEEEVATGREDQMRVAIAKPLAVGRFAVARGEFAAFVAATGHKTDGGCYRLSEPKREPDRATAYRNRSGSQIGTGPLRASRKTTATPSSVSTGMMRKPMLRGYRR
jgi:formylglycine-generating enzyme required for sulfatase activity